MKVIYVALMMGALISVALSCKKSSNPVIEAGKWQETELHAYIDSANVVTRDSTYLQPFSATDYVQFNTNGTCTLGSGHVFLVDGTGYPTIPQAVTPVVSTVKYSSFGAQYILSAQTGINFGGITVGDTVSLLSPDKLLIHDVIHTFPPGYDHVIDSYYQKANN